MILEEKKEVIDGVSYFVQIFKDGAIIKTIDDGEKIETKKEPPKLTEAELGKLDIMEGIASNYEKMLSLEENQMAVMEGLASLYEGGIKNG